MLVTYVSGNVVTPLHKQVLKDFIQYKGRYNTRSLVYSVHAVYLAFVGHGGERKGVF